MLATKLAHVTFIPKMENIVTASSILLPLISSRNIAKMVKNTWSKTTSQNNWSAAEWEQYMNEKKNQTSSSSSSGNNGGKAAVPATTETPPVLTLNLFSS